MRAIVRTSGHHFLMWIVRVDKRRAPAWSVARTVSLNEPEER
jgi:hypothetical protein